MDNELQQPTGIPRTLHPSTIIVWLDIVWERLPQKWEKSGRVCNVVMEEEDVGFYAAVRVHVTERSSSRGIIKDRKQKRKIRRHRKEITEI